MVELMTPDGLRAMPQHFRINTFDCAPCPQQGFRIKATLFHVRASIAVTWTARNPDERLRAGALVSPRYLGNTLCQNGLIGISRAVLLDLPDRSLDLFSTVPPPWVADRSLLARASALWGLLPLPYQELFNGVLWNADRFERFCNGPGSVSGHHSEKNGNLRHMVETGEAVLALLPSHRAAHPAIALAAALLHDVGKADEYRATERGWVMTDHGKLNGHKQAIGDWIAVAESRMRLKLPEAHYLSLRHALAAAKGVPFESGYRTPKTPEARLLSLADQSSGSGDLYARQAAADGGWGLEHHHLGGEAPFTVLSLPAESGTSSCFPALPRPVAQVWDSPI